MKVSQMLMFSLVAVVAVTMVGCGQGQMQTRKSDPAAIVQEVVRITAKNDWSGLVPYLDAKAREEYNKHKLAAEQQTREDREFAREARKYGIDLDAGRISAVTRGLRLVYLNSYHNEYNVLQIEVLHQGAFKVEQVPGALRRRPQEEQDAWLAKERYIACINSHYTHPKTRPWTSSGVIVLSREGENWIIDRETSLKRRPPEFKEFCK